MSPLGTAVRLCAVAGAAAALAASGSSSANRPDTAAAPQGPEAPPPPGRAMDAQRALGLWKSSFGPVKIERDGDGGPDQLNGVWVYDRAGEEVVGYFAGQLGGNVLQFRWQEPNRPRDLVGEGYLVFDPNGQSFTGRWWTSARDRGGEWSGWRQEARGEGQPPGPDEGNPPEGEAPPDEPPGPAEQAPRPRRQGPAEQAPPQEGPAEEAPPPEEEPSSDSI